VVDGEFDRKALLEFAGRLRPNVKIRPRVSQRSISKAVRVLRALEAEGLKSAIWVTDGEGQDADRLQKSMESAVTAAKLKIRVRCVVAVPMLEAWLIADETIVNPKAELRRRLRQANRPYTAREAARIASEISLETLSRRCPGFVRFTNALRRL
jgi:hypothetical protein